MVINRITKLFRGGLCRIITHEEWKWKSLGRDNKRVYAALAIDSARGDERGLNVFRSRLW